MHLHVYNVLDSWILWPWSTFLCGILLEHGTFMSTSMWRIINECLEGMRWRDVNKFDTQQGSERCSQRITGHYINYEAL